MDTFSIGDTVEATGTFNRVDRKCRLVAGERAKVVEVFQANDRSPQIIGIKLLNGMKMIDIVCYESVPLKKV